jgi:hypothetical protein
VRERPRKTEGLPPVGNGKSLLETVTLRGITTRMMFVARTETMTRTWEDPLNITGVTTIMIHMDTGLLVIIVIGIMDVTGNAIKTTMARRKIEIMGIGLRSITETTRGTIGGAVEGPMAAIKTGTMSGKLCPTRKTGKRALRSTRRRVGESEIVPQRSDFMTRGARRFVLCLSLLTI